jgi:superfamily II DNA or RNA helicase
VDEAQHDGALSLRNLYCDMRPSYILGLTATPYRSDRIKLSFEKQITDADIHQLIEMGYLSPYRHFTFAGQFEAENVAATYAREPHRWGKSLIFFPRLDACRRCQAVLAERGIDAEVVSASSNRERQLEEFAAGHVSVLLSMAILAEGFDCPTLETVFLRPSGKACTIQMGGRVLRKHPELVFKNIVQCQYTRCAFPRVARPAEQYAWVDGQWRSLTINPRIAEIAGRALQVIARSKVHMPTGISPHAKPRTWKGNVRSDDEEASSFSE